jgi:hypothetical protein
VINARHSKDNEALIQQANHFHPAKHHVRCVEAPAWPLHIVPTFAAHAIPLAAADMAAIFSGFGYSTFLQVPKADHTVRQRIDSSSTASASSRRRHLYPASLEMESDGVIEAMLEQTAPTVNAGHAMIPSREEVDELNASKDSTTYQKNVRRLQHSR